MTDYEKYPSEKAERVSETSSDVGQDGIYAREELMDPSKEETLHRGLSARQISMIAVSFPPCALLSSYLGVFV